MNFPNLFLIGPPKCATTSLHAYLNNHANIYMSNIKETHFFDLNFKLGYESYSDLNFSQVSHNNYVVGESTATYSFLPFVAERISDKFPKSKIILIVRDPVMRAFSEWLMRKGKGDEPLDFLKSLNSNCENLIELTEANWLERENYLQNLSTQPYRVYIQSSSFGNILELYLKYFPSEQIHLVSFNELKTNPMLVLNEIFDFLGLEQLDSNFETPVLNPYSVKKKYSALLYNKFGKKNVQFLWKLIPAQTRKQISSKFNNVKVNKPSLSKEEILLARKFFESDMNKFVSLQQANFNRIIVE